LIKKYNADKDGFQDLPFEKLFEIVVKSSSMFEKMAELERKSYGLPSEIVESNNHNENHNSVQVIMPRLPVNQQQKNRAVDVIDVPNDDANNEDNEWPLIDFDDDDDDDDDDNLTLQVGDGL